MIPLLLVFTGMRVPDFSRPHKPKPMQRAVLDKATVKAALLAVAKIEVDPLITGISVQALLPTEEHSPEARPVYSSVSLLSQDFLSPRAPPA